MAKPTLSQALIQGLLANGWKLIKARTARVTLHKRTWLVNRVTRERIEEVDTYLFLFENGHARISRRKCAISESIPANRQWLDKMINAGNDALTPKP